MMPATFQAALQPAIAMRRILTLLAASLTLTGALAADPPKPAGKATSASEAAAKPAGSKSSLSKPAAPAKLPLMTREELRDCMTREARVRSQTDATLQAQTELDAQKAEIARQDQAVKDELPTLDRTSAEAVNAYNAKVQARDKLIDDYNARGPAFNAGAEALQNERAAYAKACDKRRFDEADEAAIKKGQ